jgi:hypothetical protein
MADFLFNYYDNEEIPLKHIVDYFQCVSCDYYSSCFDYFQCVSCDYYSSCVDYFQCILHDYLDALTIFSAYHVIIILAVLIIFCAYYVIILVALTIFSAYHGHVSSVMDISPYKLRTNVDGSHIQPEHVHVVRIVIMHWLGTENFNIKMHLKF